MSTSPTSQGEQFRLLLLAEPPRSLEWVLLGDEALTVGRSRGCEDAPQINLWPDISVSRRHAKMWVAEGACWVEDLDSKLGTSLNGRAVRPGQATRLAPGDIVRCGETRLLLLGAHWEAFRCGPLLIDFEPPPVLGDALARCGQIALSRLAVHNCSARPTSEAVLGLRLGEVATATALVPGLEPSASRVLPRPKLDVDLGALEAVEEGYREEWSIAVNHEGFEGCRPATWVLAHNEFPFTLGHAMTLAAFVLPNNPAVRQLATEACGAGAVDSRSETSLEKIYEALHSSWRIHYQHEPAHYDLGSQKIRLAPDVLSEPNRRIGQGTCLDLALLIAGALESLKHQPIVAVLDQGLIRHALVGCWRQRGPRLEPLLQEKVRLLRDAEWVDPNGCTRGATWRQSFGAAREKAFRLLDDQPLVFALDVCAARLDGMTPLPVVGEPHRDTIVQQALEIARKTAENAGARLSVVPLFIGLLGVHDGAFRRAFAREVSDADTAAQKVASALPDSSVRSPSLHYSAVLGAARAAAKAEGSPSLSERHLVSALLDVQSEALDEALGCLGIDRASLRAALERFAPQTFRSDTSVFRRSSSSSTTVRRKTSTA